MTRPTCSPFRSSAVLAALLLILLSRSSAFAQAPQGAAICVDVDVRFTERHPAATFISSLQDEASSIWERYGVRVEWPGLATPGCAPPQASFVVLVAYEHSPSSRAWTDELGSTHVIPGVIEHAPICVNRETAERVLATMTQVQLARALNRSTVNSTDVGRAMGRVLAHELGHVLLAAGDHQREGLMRPSFSLEDLIRPHSETFSLSAPEVERLRQRFVSGVKPTYRAPLASLRCGERVIGH